MNNVIELKSSVAMTYSSDDAASALWLNKNYSLVIAINVLMYRLHYNAIGGYTDGRMYKNLE